MKAIRYLMMSVSGGALLAACTPALAQSVSAPAPKSAAAPDQQAQVAEVVVTAQKRAQNLQDVPVAVTAISREALVANRVVTVMDLTGLVPGLLARENAGSLGSPSYSLRGVFASASTPGQDREISTYLDGVYIGGTRGATFDLPDLSSAEVLRGPQGTLFGRNATAGAVNLTTRDPSGDFRLRQDFTVGNEDQFRSRTSIDFPTFGPFSAYVTYVHDQKRGDVRNLGAGTTFDRTNPFTNIGLTHSPQWLGGHNNNDVFFALKFAPTENFSAVYKFDWSHSDITPEARGGTAINSGNLVGFLLNGILAAQPAGGGAYGPVVLDPSGQRPDAVNNAWTQPGYLKEQGHNLTMQWRPLDNLSVKNITAYRSTSVYGPASIMGLDGLEYTAAAKTFYNTPLPFLGGASLAQIFGNGNLPVGSYFAGYEGNSYGTDWQVSNETQLNYQNRFVTLTVGGLYYHASELDSGLPGFQSNFSFQPTPELLPLGNVQVGTAVTTSYAAYAQGELHITHQLDLVLGGRITNDTKDGELITGGTFTGTRQSGQIVGTTAIPWHFENTKPTYSVGVNYKLTPDLLVYGKYSTAFLSGGAVGALPYAPETVSSWEAGIKSEWFDRRLRANLALYDATYDHQQSAQSGQNAGHPELAVVVVDNGTLKAKGFEAEVTAVPIEGLTLNGTLSYTNGKLLDPNPEVAQGNPYLWAADPPWAGNVSAEYKTRPLFRDAYMTLRLDANYTGKYRAVPNPLEPVQVPLFAPYEFVPSTWLINGRVALREIKLQEGKAEVAIWAKNITNNKNPTYPLLFGQIEFDDSWQPARTFGLDVSYVF